MASQLRRPPASASLKSLLAQAQALSRRVPAWRALVALIATILVVQTLTAAGRATNEAQAAWVVDRDVWVAERSIDAGSVIGVGDVVRLPAPTALRPVDAAAENPTGERSRVALAEGEIVRLADLGAIGAGPVAALIATGEHALTVTVAADIYAVGDLVGLVAILDGRILVDDGIVVSVQPGSVTASVRDSEVSRVVGELSRGGVEVTLVGR
jgi:hypothetical protein